MLRWSLFVKTKKRSENAYSVEKMKSGLVRLNTKVHAVCLLLLVSHWHDVYRNQNVLKGPGLQKKSFREIVRRLSRQSSVFFFLPGSVCACVMLCYHALLQHLEGISGTHVASSFMRLTFVSVVCGQPLTLFFLRVQLLREPSSLRGISPTHKKENAHIRCIVWLANLFSCCVWQIFTTFFLFFFLMWNNQSFGPGRAREKKKTGAPISAGIGSFDRRPEGWWLKAACIFFTSCRKWTPQIRIERGSGGRQEVKTFLHF